MVGRVGSILGFGAQVVLVVALWSVSQVEMLGQGQGQEVEAADPLLVNLEAWDGAPSGHELVRFRSRHKLASGEWNGNPVAFWSDGSKLWVVEWFISKLFAYRLNFIVREPDFDFDQFIETGNRSARGIWSDGRTMWVSDEFTDRVFAYGLENRERLPDLDITTLAEAGNESPMGMWSNGETIWIADDGDDKVYAYNLTNHEREPQHDINDLAIAGNTRIRDIWSDGETLWVTDTGTWTPWGGWVDGRVFAYDLETGRRVPARDIDYQVLREVGMESPNALWGDESTLWVGDRPHHYTYVFNLNRSELDEPPSFDDERDLSRDVVNLGAAGNTHPSQVWANGETLWVADTLDRVFYAYDLASQERRDKLDYSWVELFGDRPFVPVGFWSDGSMAWVVDWYTTYVFAFDVTTRQRVPSAEFGPLATSGNQHPAGMWSDGDTAWIVDRSDGMAYAYNLATGHRLESADLRDLAQVGNPMPQGIWGDGETIWIGDWEEDRLFAYRKSDGLRLPNRDFTGLLAAGNLSPTGFWSDGSTLWVSDHADARVYVYDFPPAFERPPGAPSVAMSWSLDGRLVVEFSGSLFGAEHVNGPYVEVESAQSPYVVETNESTRFYTSR